MEANSPEPAKPKGLESANASAAAAEPVSGGPEKPDSVREASEEPSIIDELKAFFGWCGQNPLYMAVFTAFLGFFIWLFGYHEAFIHNTVAVMRWTWDGASPNSDQEHGRMVPFIALGLIWMARHRLRAAVQPGSNWGLLSVGLGILLFIFAIRCVQPRMALASIPFLIVGSASFLWGNQVAKQLLFPAFFTLFMIPVAAISQATFELQFLITETVGFITQFIGIGIQAMGTTLTAADGSFNFEIAEGCSGIRSLAAMVMLTAVYVHLTQDRMWKKLVIFGCSLIFAIIGNIGRILAIVLTARYYDPEFAAGMMHDYSGYVFFPVAVVAMLIFAKLVNLVGDVFEKKFGKKEAVVEGGAQ